MDKDQGVWNVECRTCGLLRNAANKVSVPLIVAEHWLEIHGGVAAVEGRDWISYAGVSRCDVCHVPVEYPAWLHTAPEPLGDDFEDLDGRWVLCDACHELFVQRKLAGLVRRWVEVTQTLIHGDEVPGLDREGWLLEMRVIAAGRFRVLFERLDGGVRVDRQPRSTPW